MTHRGVPQTILSALPKLLKLAKSPEKSRLVLGCRGQARMHTPSPQAREIAALDWSHCPLDILDGPHFRAIQQLDRLSAVSPLSGWPHKYAAWAVAGLLMLRDAREVG